MYLCVLKNVVKLCAMSMENRISQVITNIMFNGKVYAQDVRALAEIGVPVFDIMLSSLDTSTFVKGIVDYHIKQNKDEKD